MVNKNKNFQKRIFTSFEINACEKRVNKINCFAKRFAAKEALVKAIGTGFRKNLNFRDIQIFNDKLGKPYYSINPKIMRFIKEKKRVKNFNLFLSISDEKDYSIAFTTLQTK